MEIFGGNLNMKKSKKTYFEHLKHSKNLITLPLTEPCIILPPPPSPKWISHWLPLKYITLIFQCKYPPITYNCENRILWLRRRVECPECRVGLSAESLLTHIQVQHGIIWGDQGWLYPHHHPLGRLRPIGSPSRKRSHASGAQWRDYSGGRPDVPTSRFNLRTTTWKILLWSWRRETGPIPTTLNVKISCPKNNWTTGIPPLPSVDGGWVETMMLDRIGGIGGGGDGTNRLRPPSHGGILFQVSRAGPVGFRWWVDGGDPELAVSVA